MKNLIFNPYTHIAGTKAFLSGISGIIITGILCYLSHVHLDGIIDIHFADAGNSYIYLTEGIIDLACIVLIFSLLGLLLVGFRFRFIDLIGTMAIARLPIIIVPLFAMIFPQGKISDYLMFTFLKIGTPVTISNMDIIGFVFMMLIVILILIWTIALMYNAFKICINIKGAKMALTFIAGLIIAEVISKIIFISLNITIIPTR